MTEFEAFLDGSPATMPFRLCVLQADRRRALVDAARQHGIAVVDIHDARQRGLSSERELFLLIAEAIGANAAQGSLTDILREVSKRLIAAPTPRVLLVRCNDPSLWQALTLRLVGIGKFVFEECTEWSNGVNGRPAAILVTAPPETARQDISSDNESTLWEFCSPPNWLVPGDSSGATHEKTLPRIDIGIITIKREEFECVLDEFPDPPGGWHEPYVSERTGRHYNLRVADGGHGVSYNIALAKQAEQGPGEAQALAHDFTADLEPRLLLVVGIAGGAPTSDITLGDVLVSTRINDYTVQAARYQKDTEYAIGGGPVAASLRGSIANVTARFRKPQSWARGLPPQPPVEYSDPERYDGDEAWKRDVRRAMEEHFSSGSPREPRVVDGVLGSSGTLIKDPGVIIGWLRSARNLLAVEMEAAGVYRAVANKCPMLAIRGISDIVGFRRDERWTRYAARSAAAFTRAFLQTQPVPPGPQLAESHRPTDPKFGPSPR